MKFSTARLLATVAIPATMAAMMTGAVQAQDMEEVEVSASVTLTNDYRFRGVSLSDRDIAIQGDIGVSFGGFHIGAWSSSIADFQGTTASSSTTEVDWIAGYGFDLDDNLSMDVGVTYYTYPGAKGVHYFEPYASLGTTLGDAEVGFTFAYVPSQDSTGNDDNVYLALDVSQAIDDNFSVTGHFGYEDGAFAPDGKLDWQIGLATSFKGIDVGIAYIDTDVAGRATKGGVLLSIGKSF